MEANLCDVNHLDGDVVLPPRKRLLAGLKRQSPDGDASLQLSLVASSLASASASASTPPLSPTCDEFSTRLSNLLHSYHGSLTPDEIVAASKSAASSARKAAQAARVAAEEKAAAAARAVAAAKSALDLVASFSEEPISRERHLRKSKFKKHIPVQLLYKKHQPVENCRKDEEIARKLHRAINSSPRITKNSSGSDTKDHKHKKPKTSISSEKTRDSNGGLVLEKNHTSSSNVHAVAAIQIDF